MGGSGAQGFEVPHKNGAADNEHDYKKTDDGKPARGAAGAHQASELSERCSSGFINHVIFFLDFCAYVKSFCCLKK